MNMLNRTDIWIDLNYFGQVFLPSRIDLKFMFPIPKKGFYIFTSMVAT